MPHRSRSSREYPNNGRSSYTNGHRSSRDREVINEKTPRTVPADNRRERRRSSLPQYNHNGHEVTKGIHPEGESGRGGFNPIKFLVISGRSSSTPSLLVNCLWPIVPIAIALVRTLHMSMMHIC
jgi:Ca2+:H+ antiporter